MPLSHTQKLAIYRSLPKIVLHQREFGEYFYKRIFEEMPAARAMFKSAVPIQHQRFTQTLIVSINALDNPERFNKIVVDIAQKHTHHHLQYQHYEVLGVDFIDAIAVTLGDEFTEIMREAWTALYQSIITTMVEVASQSN
ncbi:MAG: globin domain-containing protein [Phototrophicaceae bacterium]